MTMMMIMQKMMAMMLVMTWYMMMMIMKVVIMFAMMGLPEGWPTSSLPLPPLSLQLPDRRRRLIHRDSRGRRR